MKNTPMEYRPGAMKRYLASLFAAAVLPLAACGDSAAGLVPFVPPVLTPPPATGPAAVTLSGTWGFTQTVSSKSTLAGPAGFCESVPLAAANYSGPVAQSGNSVTVTIGSDTIQGTISGNSVTWVGSFSDPDPDPLRSGATITLLDMTATVAPDGLTLSGTSSAIWSKDVIACSISGPVVAQKL